MLYYIDSYRGRLLSPGLGFLLAIAFQITIIAQTASPPFSSEKPAQGIRSELINNKTVSFAGNVAGHTSAVSGSIKQRALILNNIGAQYAAKSKWDSAVAPLERAIAVAPRLAEPYINLSVVYEKLERIDESIGAARKATEISPGYIRGWHQLCDLYLFSKRFAPAARCFESLQKLEPPDKVFYLRYGLSLVGAKEFDRALPVLNKATVLLPSSPVGWNASGMIQYSKKKFRKAVKMFQRAVDINPDFSNFRFNLALAQLGDRNRAAAISQYRVLKESDPNCAQRLYRILYHDMVVFAGKR